MPFETPISLPCPHCGYNVIGQVQEHTRVCPECGGALPEVTAEPLDTLPLRWERVARKRPPTRLVLIALLTATFLPAVVLLAGVGVRAFLVRHGRPAIGNGTLILVAIVSGLAAIPVLLVRLSKDTPLVFLLTPLVILAAALVALCIAQILAGVF